MSHFSADNTNGYSMDQLTRANTIMDARSLDPREQSDEYKHACEETLEMVEGHADEMLGSLCAILKESRAENERLHNQLQGQLLDQYLDQFQHPTEKLKQAISRFTERMKEPQRGKESR